MIPLSKRMELSFWSVLPGCITLLLIVLYLVPKHISGFSSVMPLLHLAPVFYWGMQHAREMPYWFVFIIGLIIDSIQGLPLGASSLVYVFFLALLHAQRKYIHKEGFLIKWGFFSALLLVAGGVQWIMLTSVGSRAHDLGAPLVQWLLTVGSYPLFHWIFDMLAHHIASRRWMALHGR